MKPAAADSDADLLQRALSGDAEAFSALYRRRHGAVYRYAFHMCGSEAIAEDVTQEVFLALLRDGRGYESGRGSLGSYLIGIARNQVLRILERERVSVPLMEEAEEEISTERWLATPSNVLAQLTLQQTLDALRKAVLSLPPAYREVVVLCDLEEMSYAQAAETLSCAVGTVRSRLSRARRMLMERMLSRVQSARCPA